MSHIREIEVSFLPGTEFKEAADAAYELSHLYRCPVLFSFNGIPIRIGGGHDGSP